MKSVQRVEGSAAADTSEGSSWLSATEVRRLPTLNRFSLTDSVLEARGGDPRA